MNGVSAQNEQKAMKMCSAKSRRKSTLSFLGFASSSSDELSSESESSELSDLPANYIKERGICNHVRSWQKQGDMLNGEEDETSRYLVV
jgi:hypothetical protein